MYNFLTYAIAFFTIIVYTSCENHDVTLLQEYIKIYTAYPNPDYESAIAWLEQQALNMSLEFHRIDLPPYENGSIGLPVVWMTWAGSKPKLPSVLLYNHMDVVGVDSTQWTIDPFGGDLIGGHVYGRGTQDMKSVGVQQIQAIRNLKLHEFQPTRTIHILFCPAEEIGGFAGMNLFIRTPEFKSLNIGFVLDEGMKNEDPDLVDIYYTEREMLWITFTMNGTTSHGSLLPNDTAAEKLQKVITRMLSLREKERWRLHVDKSLKLGDVTTVNLNMIEGGIQVNVVPPWYKATFDIRVTPHWNLEEFQRYIIETCELAGPGVSYELINEPISRWQRLNKVTNINEESWWWTSFQEAFESMDLPIVGRIFPAGTDGHLLREIGIPVLGFSPIFNTPNLMHGNDEYLRLDDFFRGIGIYDTLIQHLAGPSQPPRANTDSSINNKPTLRPKPSTQSKKPGKSASTSIKSYPMCFIFIFSTMAMY